MNRLRALLERHRIRRARRHYGRAITRVEECQARRTDPTTPPDPAQQRDIDLATIWQIWGHTLDRELGADQ